MLRTKTRPLEAGRVYPEAHSHFCPTRQECIWVFHRNVKILHFMGGLVLGLLVEFFLLFFL